MAIKVDLEKAYDRLKWDFIRNTLMEMRIPQNLVDVIMMCITTCSMRILWNGEATEAFYPTRGIRQGDPLSPYIFVACVERLSRLIEEAVVSGLWHPIQASCGGPKLLSLLFADDLILFAEASIEQSHFVKDCLDRFCEASGQKGNASKSRIYFSPNTCEQSRESVCEVLGMSST